MTVPSIPTSSTTVIAPTGHAMGWSAPITGLRGLGAVVVVVGHTWFASRIFPYTGSIHFLSIVVPIFFVISGYALYRPFLAAQVARTEPPSAVSFWWRRFLRIYPLYAAALTVYLIALPGVRPPGGRVIDYAKLYGFLGIYDPDLVTFSGIPASWFIADEVVFYLLLPLFADMTRRVAIALAGRRHVRYLDVRRANIYLAVTLIVVGQVSRPWLLLRGYPGATSLPVSNMDFYGFGMLLAVWSVPHGERRVVPKAVDFLRRTPAVAGVVAAGAVVAMAMIAKDPGASSGPHEDIQRYLIYGAVVIPLMILTTLGSSERGFNRMLSSPRWNRLAILSLHMYLWHQLVLGGFDRYVTDIADVRIGSRFTTGLILCTGAVVATALWSAIWRPALDAPSARWSKLIPRPVEAGPRPLWFRPAAIALVITVLAGGAVLAVSYGGTPFRARGGVNQIAATGAHEGDLVELLRDGDVVKDHQADANGAAVLWDLAPGRYDVRLVRDGREVITETATVTSSDDHPDRALYADQHLTAGLNEIITRDGTHLSAFVDLPGPAEDGPYPTVVEYSGYRLGDPDETQPASAIARALGYATVGVNVRGTGCSGGAFELLGPAQAADGYDVVETVATQPWVKGSTVGLVGYSYGGLGALEVASTNPPSLTSVVALSVYGEAWEAFHPGGLENSGFPVGWLQDMAADAAPLGADWVRDRIVSGDEACARNQELHGQQLDAAERFLGDAPNDGRFDAASPASWAPTIEVPVFLAGQLQDATIGTDLAQHLADFIASPSTKLLLTNGTHGDGLAPQVVARVQPFLDLYVNRQVPDPFDPAEVLATIRPGADLSKLDLGPPSPVEFLPGEPFDVALARYEDADDVEVLFDSGGGALPGAAAATSSVTFATWPPSESDTVALSLQADASLAADAQDGNGLDADPASFETDPAVSGDSYNVDSSDFIRNTISKWIQPSPETTVGWVSEPLTEDAALVGDTSLDLSVRIDDTDADIQASLTQIDRDGNETLIQVGWRRLSDVDGPVTPGEWQQVKVELGPVAHLLRAGSRLRVIVGTPGAGQAQWNFAPPPEGPATVDIGQGGKQASMLEVPMIGSFPISTPAPSCGDLRGQPCRPYEPLTREAPTS